MKVTELSLPISIHSVRLGLESYRVMRPLRSLDGHISHRQIRHSPFRGELDRRSFQALTIAWAFAARSPRTVTYLPFSSVADNPTLDLVLIHHSLQMRPAVWKAIRGRLRVGHAETLSLPVSAYPIAKQRDEHLRWRNRDRIGHVVAANTLILVGSRPAFERDLGALAEVVEDGPALRAVDPAIHIVAEVADQVLRMEFVGR